MESFLVPNPWKMHPKIDAKIDAEQVIKFHEKFTKHHPKMMLEPSKTNAKQSSQNDTKIIPKLCQPHPKIMVKSSQNDANIIPKWCWNHPKTMLKCWILVPPNLKKPWKTYGISRFLRKSLLRLWNRKIQKMNRKNIKKGSQNGAKSDPKSIKNQS